LEQINPDELDPDELMDGQENDVMQDNSPEHIQLGFVETPEWTVDPQLHLSYLNAGLQSYKTNAEATRLWAKFFAPGSSHTLVLIPQIWADFFTAVLLNPVCFLWAKQFLSSEACSMLGQPNAGIQFSLPASCPSENSLPCLQDLELPQIPSTLEEANISSPLSNLPLIIKVKVNLWLLLLLQVHPLKNWFIKSLHLLVPGPRIF
jgi:hypothetical protein